MNKILGSSLMMTAVLLITSCDKTQSYADMLKAEERLNHRFIAFSEKIGYDKAGSCETGGEKSGTE